MSTRLSCFLLLVILCISAGCANITAPTGGKKDIIPPKLRTIDPADSQLNTKVKRIEMHFDEYITVSDAAKEVQISPILAMPPTVIGKNKTVVVKIVDSLLEDSTTYRVTFGTAIKDLHEGNAFKNFSYTFSTGSYFDSLQIRGSVINAATGKPDTGNVIVTLYSAAENDSAVERKKPKYIAKVGNSGAFVIKGLPCRAFRIYALKDISGNLFYDGPEQGEMIGFNNTNVWPGDTSESPVNLRIFAERIDTASKKDTSIVQTKKGLESRGKPAKNEGLTYAVNVDTSNSEKRTFDFTRPLKVTFSKPMVLNKDKIKLTYDSAGVKVTPAITMKIDSAHPRELLISTAWQMDRVYTLRLPKGFAQDTAGVDVMPSRFTFRTWNDDDYGKITVHLPTKYYQAGQQYVLMVIGDRDTVYQQPVTDTIVKLHTLRPASYTFCIIVDKNGNGKWDTGDLLGRIQPEEVIPYNDQLILKPGWENIVDFEQAPQDRKAMRGGTPK